jgi:2-polyprenyl-6-hydroxyphenyl methylase/3-demethylubiquinone-9 3-methyltransferase
MAMTDDQALRFGFGSNWQSYVEGALTQRRIESAIASLRTMLGVADLQGRSFLDIGCGSGLFSLAAVKLGAARVESFDYDGNSVHASEALRARAGISAEQWQIRQGSVLDEADMAQAEPADVVYSWGVLHHTGAMWPAIEAAASKVLPGGLFAIAIYNDVSSRLVGSARWHAIKRIYNRAPVVGKRAMEFGYASAFMLKDAASLQNPLTTFQRYNSQEGRGMDFWHDVRDWLGGYPYEYASAGEVFTFVHGRLGFQLEYLKTLDGLGCNEFTFRRPAA